jgi:aspartate carbamoyltransferase catalytic subunit
LKSSTIKNHLLDTEHLTLEQLNLIFERTKNFKDKETAQIYSGKKAVFLFYEASTRTKGSFQVACDNLGIKILDLSPQNSSFVKGESLLDTANNLEAIGADIFIMRHNQSGIAKFLSEKVNVPVINGGDGMHAHPTQALLDAYTLVEHFGSIEGKKIAIIGDIKHSRVARSNIYSLKLLGAKVTLVGPPTFIPDGIENFDVDVEHDLENVLDNDVIMALRIQKERQTGGFIPSFADYTKSYGINKTHLKKLGENTVIMHPGPINRGVELTDEVADSTKSLILKQVQNGVYTRMAVISLLLEGEL